MNIIERTDKQLELPISNQPKKLIGLVGGRSSLNYLRTLTPFELGKSLSLMSLGNFRFGARSLGFTFSLMAYYYYRKYYEQKFVTSESLYRLTKTLPINGNSQFYKQKNVSVDSVGFWDYFYRMPKKEFDVFYRMKPAYLKGYFDHKKEILFPEEKDGIDGYRVITPFYFFSCLFDDPSAEEKKIVQDKGGLAVDRGW